MGAGKLDGGDDGLSEIRVGHTEDCDVQYSWKSAQRVFDFGRVHVEPARDNDVLIPPKEPKTSAVIDFTDITGDEPAVGCKGFRGGSGILPVARKHIRTAGLDDPNAV